MTENSTPGYEALTSGAALLDLSSRGRIRVTGEDRARLLHAMTTNHVQQMKSGDGIYAFFLNAQGRILADCVRALLRRPFSSRHGTGNPPGALPASGPIHYCRRCDSRRRHGARRFRSDWRGQRRRTPPRVAGCRRRIIDSRMFLPASFWWRPFPVRARMEFESMARPGTRTRPLQ